MALVNFANLDFDQIKQSITDYADQTLILPIMILKDPIFQLLSMRCIHITYITSYNANMVSNEVFGDSATLRENVVSLARNIGYTPQL